MNTTNNLNSPLNAFQKPANINFDLNGFCPISNSTKINNLSGTTIPNLVPPSKPTTLTGQSLFPQTTPTKFFDKFSGDKTSFIAGVATVAVLAVSYATYKYLHSTQKKQEEPKI
jgi:hypothetical protein